MNDFLLSTEERKILDVFLSSLPNAYRCQQCHNSAGTESARFTLPFYEHLTHEVSYPDSDFIAVVCNKCGFTRFFRGVTIGLARNIPPPMPSTN